MGRIPARRQSPQARGGFRGRRRRLARSFNRTLENPDAEGEARYLTLGRGYADRLLLVVWTERDGDVIRIISARKASPGEARHYED